MSSDRLPVGMPLIGQRPVAAQRHDRAFAELLFDLLQRRLQRGVMLR